MYLNNKHFKNVLRLQNIKPEEFDKFERLSSKAVLFSTGSRVLIVYVNTIVFIRNNNIIQLNTGGWDTVTTKKWINYGLSCFTGSNVVTLYQEKYVWYIVQNDDEPEEYRDNMKIQLED